MKNKQTGFTLIEIMVVMVIIAVIAGFAYPSYVDSVRKSKRTDAKTALLTLKSAQEKFRTNCIFYAAHFLDSDGTNDTPDAETCDASDVNKGDLGNSSNSSPQGHYTIAISGTISGTEYTATATATGDQANDTGCTTFTLTIDAGGDTLTPQECL